MHVFPALTFALIAFGHPILARPVSTGPTVVQFDSTQVSGSFFTRDASRKRIEIPVAPGKGIACSLHIQKIDQHRAEPFYEGWHIEYLFAHPDLEENETAVLDFFWNAKSFAHPFLPRFLEKYKYLEPFTDPPISYEAEFNEKENELTIEAPYFFSEAKYTFATNADRNEIRRFSFEIATFGKRTSLIHCETASPLKLK